MNNRLVDLQTMLSSRATHFWVLVILAAVATILGLAWPATLQAQSESNVTLSSLSVSGVDGTAIDLGTFDPTDTTYSATVTSTVNRVTVEATASSPDRADVNFGPIDASAHDDGYQVNLQYGTNLILIGVFSWYQDHEVLNTYSVEITREGTAPAGSANIVSIHGQYQEGNVYGSLAREGSTFPFVLTRTGDTSESLTVQVVVSENSSTMSLPSDPVESVFVEFEAGHASARLDVETTADSIATGTYQLYARLARGAGYQVDPRGGIALWFVWEDDYGKLNLADISVIYRGAVVDIGKFDPTVTSYTGNVGSTVEYVTITATEPSHSIRSTILPGDSNPDIAGHQVDLSYGTNQIIVVAQPLFGGRGRDGRINTYSLHINRAGSAEKGSEAEVSAISISLAAEGVSIPFLLTRTGDTSEALTAQVEVTEAGGDMVSTGSKGEFDVEFEAGHASARLDVSTNADEVWEEHSTVEVTVKEGSSYQVSSESGAASTAVRDDDVPTVTAALTVDSTEVEEGDEITATITFVTDGPKEPHVFMGTLLLRAEAGTAGEKDFQLYSRNNLTNRSDVSTSVGGWGFDPVESGGVITSYQYQYSAKILITDDDRPEADESFRAYLEIGERSKDALILDEDSDSHIITIRGGEETPASPNSFGYATVVVADSGTSGSAFTVTWTHARTCSRETASLTYAGNPAGQGYAAAIVPTEYVNLGSANDGKTQITRSLDDTEGMGTDFVVSLYCSGLVSEVPIPTEVKWHGEKPKPGTYSSEPPLNGLTVSSGTLSPAFSKYGSLYAILDFPNDQQQITLSPTVKPGYTVSWDPATDADLTVPGHQVDLDAGYNTISLAVDPDQGGMSFTYDIIVKRSETGVEANSPATGTPTISGTTQVGQTLTADTTGIADTDGLTNVSYDYQWLADDAEIASATGNTYVLTSAELGKAVKVRVSFTDDAGNEEALTSEATDAVAAAPPPPPDNVRAVTQESGAVELTWEAPQDATVTGYRIERSRADENRGGQQRSNGRPRDNHTLVEDTGSAETGYTDKSAEKGVEYEYRVSAHNEAGTGEASEWVRAGPESASNSPATGLPAISGTAVVGETLTADITGIADMDGLTNGLYGYQWVKNDGTTDTDIENATGSTYKLVAADQGRSVKVRVTFTDDGGNEETLTSAPTAPVLGDGRPGAPRNLAATAGNREVTLSWDPPADNGNAPATGYRIEWRVDGKDYDKTIWGTAGSTTYTTNVNANLANGVKYFFRVSAGNGSGNSYGPYGPSSEEVSATPTSGSAVDLGTPVLSNTENLHHGMVQLDWEDIEGAGWYVVQYYHVQSGEWLDLPAEGVDVAFHGSSAVVSNLHGLSWLRVRAMSCAGESEWSQIEQLFGTNASDWEGVPVPEVEEGDEIEPCPVVLGTPVLSDTENLHHGMVRLDWEDIEDAGWYVVQYYHVKGGEWLDLPAAGVDVAFHGSSAVVSNLHGLSWLRVRAMSCAGESEWSQIEQLFGTNESDWEGVPVPEVEEGDEIEPCSEDADTPDNSPATGVPTISGTAQVGETLTANTSGIADSDGLTNATFSYQWLADDTDIAGASDSTYTLTDSEEGKAIKVEVSFTDDAGNEETLTSEPTAVVAATPPPPPDNVRAVAKKSGAVELTWDAPHDATVTGYRIERRPASGNHGDQQRSAGSPRDNHTLVEDTGSADTGYTDNTAERGVGYEYRVSARNEAGAGEESDWVNAEEATASNSTATGAPTISGTAQVGETLTADTSGIADADGLANATFSYQWLADDTDIAGATGLTYTLTDSEESKAITVRVSFTDAADNEETLTSAATAAVAAKPNSPATGEPGLSFSWMTRVGETITADTSGIADADGLTNATFSYQWLADDVEIAGATGLTYTLVAADEGKAISVRVGFTDDAGHEETLTSWATGAVVAANVGLVVNTVIAEPVREGSYARVSFSVTRFTVGKKYSFSFGAVWIADNSAFFFVEPMSICVARGLSFPMDILVDSSDTVITHEGLISDRCPAGDYKLVVSWRTEDGEEEGRHLTSFQVLEDDTEVDEYSSQYVDYITPEYPDPPAEHGPFFIGLLSTAGPEWGSVIYDWGIAGVVPDSDPDTLDYVVSLRVVDDDNNPVANCNEDGVGGSYKLYTIPEDRGWGREVTLSARCMSGAGSATFTIEFLNGSSELLLRAESPLGAARPNGDEADTPDGDDENAPSGVVINTVIAEPVQEGVGANVSVSVTGFTVGESYELSFGKVIPANVCSVNSFDPIPVDLAGYGWIIHVDSSDYVWTKEGFISPTCPAGTYSWEVNYRRLNSFEIGMSASLFTVVAALPNSPATGTPTISGTAQVGETLTANTSGVIDADGLSSVQYEHQWLADDYRNRGSDQRHLHPGRPR